MKIVRRYRDFPTDAHGVYLPCPLCGRCYCDHTEDERKDLVHYVVVEKEDGSQETRREP
jgi:hypothetical protein